MENSTSPTTNTRRRPMMSATDPDTSRSEASVSAYASTTHCRSLKLALRSFWIAGSATFTIVMSSSSMKVPIATQASVHQRFGLGVMSPSFLFGAAGDERVGQGGTNVEHDSAFAPSRDEARGAQGPQVLRGAAGSDAQEPRHVGGRARGVELGEKRGARTPDHARERLGRALAACVPERR